MQVTIEKVWGTDTGRQLLIKRDNGDYEVVVATADRETLRELHAAIVDAMIEDPITEQEQAKFIKMLEAARGKPL